MNTIIKLQKTLEKEEEEIINEKLEEIHTAIDYFDEIIKAKIYITNIQRRHIYKKYWRFR